MDTVVAPNPSSTVVTDSDRGYQRHGLEGKDAAFINQLATLEALRNITTDIHQTARDIEVNVEKSGRAGELATERTASELRLLALQGQKETALAAATNTAAIQAAIAECCCEQKELIRAEAGATRDLINSIEKDRLAADLAAARAEVSYLKFKVALPTLPV